MKKFALPLLALSLFAFLWVPAQSAEAVPLAVEIVQVSCSQDSGFYSTTILSAQVSGQVCLSYEFKWDNATPTSGNQAASSGGNRTVTVAVKCGNDIAYDSITLGPLCEI